MKQMSQRLRFTLIAAAIAAGAMSVPAVAQTVAAPAAGSATATPDNAILLTVFLRHDSPGR